MARKKSIIKGYRAYSIPKYVDKVAKERRKQIPVKVLVPRDKFDAVWDGTDVEITVPAQPAMMSLLPDNVFLIGDNEALLLDGPKTLEIHTESGEGKDLTMTRDIMITKILRDGEEANIQFILEA